MNHELAKTLTTALVQFIDRERPEGSMCCSSYECEKIEKAFEGGTYDVVEAIIKKKLSGLTEFEEKLVSFALQCGGQWNTANEEAEKWSREFLFLAKKDLQPEIDAEIEKAYKTQDDVVFRKGLEQGKEEVLKNLERTSECNPDKLPKWLKDIKFKAFKRGYNKGYKDAEKLYNTPSFIPYPPLYQSRPFCYEPGGTCTNPQMDCINCPRRSGGGFNTSSGTSTLKAEG